MLDFARKGKVTVLTSTSVVVIVAMEEHLLRLFFAWVANGGNRDQHKRQEQTRQQEQQVRLNANGKHGLTGSEAKDPHQKAEDVEEDTNNNKQQKNRKHKKQDKVTTLTYIVEWLILTSSGEGA